MTDSRGMGDYHKQKALRQYIADSARGQKRTKPYYIIYHHEKNGKFLYNVNRYRTKSFFDGVSFQTVLVKLFDGFITLGLVEQYLLIDVVPSEQHSLGPACIGGHGLYLVELFLIGAERAFYPSVSLRVGGTIKGAEGRSCSF
jgi:hypothetical protein